MTEPTASPQDSAPIEAAAPAESDLPEPAAAAPPPAFATFDPASRMVIIGSAVVFIAVLIGLVLGAWQLNPFGFVLIVAAIVAAGATWVGETMQTSDEVASAFPVVQLVAGAVATALSLLAVVEMIGDIDDMDDFGGPLGLVLGLVILGASAVVLVGATRRTAPDLRGAERGAMLAAAGAGLVLLAWVAHLTIGFWALGPASWGLAAVVVAAVLLLVAPDVRLPAWIGWVAVALGVFAAWTAFGQWGALMAVGEDRLELGLEDYLPFLVYVAGILLVIGGAVLTAVRALASADGLPVDQPPVDPEPERPGTPDAA